MLLGCCWRRGVNRIRPGDRTFREGDLADEEVEMDERSLEEQRRRAEGLPAVVRGGDEGAGDEEAPPAYKPKPGVEEISIEGGRLSTVGPPPPGYRSRFVWPERRRL